MVAFLSKSDASISFDQIVDFLNAQDIQYALMVNPTIYVLCIKQFWAAVSIKNANDVVKLRALVDGKRLVVTKDVIRHDLRWDDADGVDYLPNEEIFTELARMGYEKPPPKLTFYKAFFSAQWKFLIHTLFQCVSAKRTAWNEVQWRLLLSALQQYISYALTQKVFANMRWVGKGFSRVETPLFATMLVQPQTEVEEDEVEVPVAPTPTSPTTKPLPPPQEPITTPLQAQPTPPSSPPQEQPTTTSASDMTLLNNLLETCTTLSHKVAALDQDKVAQALEILKLKNCYGCLGGCIQIGGRIEAIDVDEDVTLVDAETQVDLGAELQRMKDDDNAAIKEVSVAEPTVFNDEKVTMTMDQTLIKMKSEKAKLLDEQMAKRLHDEELKQATAGKKQEKDDLEKAKVLQNQYKMEHFKGMTYDKVRPIFEKEFNKVQTLFKPDKDVDEEPTKKRVAEETLLQESFKNLKAVEVSSSHSTKDTPTDDLKEMSEEMLRTCLKLSQERLSLVKWSHDPMLSTRLQIEEDSEMASDLVMKIFMKANQPKSRISVSHIVGLDLSKLAIILNWLKKIHSKGLTVSLLPSDWSSVLRRCPRGGVESSQFDALNAVIGNVILTKNCDSWQWLPDVAVGYSVASARTLVDDSILETDLVATRWKSNILIKDLWSLLAKWWEVDIPVCANSSDWYDWLEDVCIPA
nr:RNA-directed DNA polymerase, eukaryota [Tanacetum cinerariifolium]